MMYFEEFSLFLQGVTIRVPKNYKLSEKFSEN